MSNVSIKFEGVPAMEKFVELTTKEMKKVAKAALRAGVSVITRETKKNIRRDFRAALNHSSKYNDRIIDGAKHSVDRQGRFAKSHVMGVRREGSQTFKLRFFEAGTQERHTRKGSNRGMITAHNFHGLAVSSSTDKVNEAMEKKLDKTIQKINEKHIK